MSGGERYQPSTPGAVECPACGQCWSELRVLPEDKYTRYWEPAETGSPSPAA
jgi:hypothetical protein